MKKSIKRIIAVCLAVMLIASAFAGCSKTGGSKKYTVGICQLVQHEALDAATKGFKEALTEKLGADNVKFVEQNAGGDSATCSTITNGFVSQGVDLILPMQLQHFRLQCSPPTQFRLSALLSPIMPQHSI